MKRFLHLLRLIALTPVILLLGLEGEGGGGGGDKGGGKGDAGDKGGGDKGKGGGDDDPGKKQVTMTQAELDALIQQRLARGSKAAVEEFLKGLGKTREEIEALVRAKAEEDEKNKTELQKAQEAAAKAEAARKAAIEAANAKLARAAFMSAALQVGIAPVCVEDAAILAAPQLAELKPDDKTGDFKADEVKEIAENLLKTKPWLKGDGKGGNVGGGSNPPGGGNITPEELGQKVAEERNKGPQTDTGGYNPWAPPKVQ